MLHTTCIFGNSLKGGPYLLLYREVYLLLLYFRFESEAAATAALHRLHQLDILGYPLSVEYARGVAEHDYSLVQKLE